MWIDVRRIRCMTRAEETGCAKAHTATLFEATTRSWRKSANMSLVTVSVSIGEELIASRLLWEHTEIRAIPESVPT